MSDRQYPDRPWIGIGCLAFRGEDVLLVRRGRPPLMGEWSVPGGAQHLGETAEEAARRELREETGVEVGSLSLAVAVDIIQRDESGAIRFHYTILDFAGRWRSGEPVAGDDVTEARFFAPGELPSLNLWDEALRAIAEGRRRIAIEPLPAAPVGS
jgi:ADP-ribose pyrophosphatase YjhB (NUDIX family)